MNDRIALRPIITADGLFGGMATYTNGDCVLCVTHDMDNWRQYVESDGVCTVQLLNHAGASPVILADFPE